MTTETAHNESLALTAVHLRAVVLALGESMTPAWWNTKIMNETGFRFLERLYPRSFFHAAVYSSGKAACDTHDRAVGRGAVYHLFRLPEILEIQMSSLTQADDDEFIALFRTGLGNTDQLIVILEGMSSSRKRLESIPGPQRIGTETDPISTMAFRRMASIYHHAFRRNKPGFPYFSVAEIGDEE